MGINTVEQLKELQETVRDLKEVSSTSLYNKKFGSTIDDSRPLHEYIGLSANIEVRDAGQIMAAIGNTVDVGGGVAAEQAILASLRYESMRTRQANILEPHTDTFDWVFNVSTEVSGLHFVEWLRSHKGIYWVSGKPGSGKSTLMKYLCTHKKTFNALEAWANDRKLVVCSHFFWNAGTDIQKSQQGLLQSLLYDILRQHPSLISATIPSRWTRMKQNPNFTSNQVEAWGRTELLETFDRLMAQLQQMPRSIKFCFFVDGLDEYDGDHTDIVNVLQKFAHSPNIKLCVSSRPWNVFEDAFGNDTKFKLRLQDLTYGDIEHYVRNKLEENRRFLLLKKSDDQYRELIEEIVFIYL